MKHQDGMTALELLVVVAVSSILLTGVAAWSIPWFAKESMRSAVYSVETYMQLARIEAISRNHPCRFALDTATQTISVLDTMNTGAINDDELLYERELTSAVAFANPQSGAPVTLVSLGSNKYHLVFDSDGTVQAGAGTVMLYGGERFGKISVFDAGGMSVERWDGNAWVPGS